MTILQIFLPLRVRSRQLLYTIIETSPTEILVNTKKIIVAKPKTNLINTKHVWFLFVV